MSTLTIRLPDDTAQRLKSLAQSRGLSMNKLVEQLSAHALAAWDAPRVFDFWKLVCPFPLTFQTPSRPLDDVPIQSAAKFFSAPLVFLLMVKKCSASYRFPSLLREKFPHLLR